MWCDGLIWEQNMWDKTIKWENQCKTQTQERMFTMLHSIEITWMNSKTKTEHKTVGSKFSMLIKKTGDVLNHEPSLAWLLWMILAQDNCK